MNTRRTGADGEEIAARYLSGKGMRIVQRNFRCRRGEIDIIGYHDGYLVFVEVKYRATAAMGRAEEAVGAAKRRQICRVADCYRYMHSVSSSVPVRYDVVAISGEAVCWYQNAFEHVYTRG